MPTSCLRIVPKNDWDDATISVSAAAEVGFEAENTQNTIRDKTWRSTSNASQSITAVWNSAITLSHFSMHRHLNHSGTFRWQLYSDAAATTQVHDSTALSATTYTAAEPYTWSSGSNDPLKSDAPTWYWHSEIASVRAAKLTFGGTPSQAYWLASRIWCGRYMELAVNPVYGMQLGEDNMTDRERTQGGSLRTNEGESWRKLTFDLNDINENELATWMDIRRYAGTSKDVLVSAFPGDGTRLEALHTIAGRFANLNDIGRQVSRLTMRAQIEEN
jgi:hypothetical protein